MTHRVRLGKVSDHGLRDRNDQKACCTIASPPNVASEERTPPTANLPRPSRMERGSRSRSAAGASLCVSKRKASPNPKSQARRKHSHDHRTRRKAATAMRPRRHCRPSHRHWPGALLPVAASIATRDRAEQQLAARQVERRYGQFQRSRGDWNIAKPLALATRSDAGNSTVPAGIVKIARPHRHRRRSGPAAA